MYDPAPIRLRPFVAGLLACVSAVTAALAYFIVTGGWDGLGLAPAIYIVGLVIAFLHLLVFALPLYLVLRERWPLTWWRSTLAGAAVGGAPASLIVLLNGSDGRDMLDLAWLFWFFWLPGATGGLAFWLALAVRAPRLR